MASVRVALRTVAGSADPDWLRLEPIRVGLVPAGLPTPDRYVTVTDREQPILRVDVYAFGPGGFAFEDAIIWHDLVVIGFGGHVHAVSLADRSCVTLALGSYYGHLYWTADYLLIASGERLFRMDPDR